MEFIEVKEVNNDKPVHYVIKSLGIHSLSQIEDSIVKQIIFEGIEKLTYNDNINRYYIISIHNISRHFIGRLYLDIWELPRFIRLYTEVMTEMGYSTDDIIKSLEYGYDNSYLPRLNTEDITNGDIICEEICIKNQIQKTNQ